MELARRAGVLLHLTSLPGRRGCGTLGRVAVDFVDWLVEAGMGAWQMLPVGPIGYGDSPYAALSSFAGSPLLVSPDRLVQEGWLDPHDVVAGAATDTIDYGTVRAQRRRELERAFDGFRRRAGATARAELEAFVEHEAQRCWLDDWALYVALKEAHGERSWTEWSAPLRRREASALAGARRELAPALAFHRWVQFVFDRQWRELHEHAQACGVEIVGDLPYYPAHDSADVWARQDLFALERDGRPRRIGGVPPDYFAKTGQRWGNPVIRWGRMAREDYAWWVDRLRQQLARADLIRLDHFRGYVAFWSIPAGDPTAENGRWVRGPGRRPFDVARERGNPLPLIAEDLGVITDRVHALRATLGLPGTRVLQFTLLGDAPDAAPQASPVDVTFYSGTHDNPPLRGWFDGLDRSERERALEWLEATPQDCVERAIEAIWRSPARLVVAPAQDLLELGAAARMNRPGLDRDNWRWRARPGELSLRLAERMRGVADRTGRVSGPRSPAADRSATPPDR